MPVIYNNCKIIPAPLVTISEEMLSAPDGRKIGTTYLITLNGTLVSDMGSPQDGSLNGVSWGGYQNLFWIGSNYPGNEIISVGSKLNSIETKQQALRALFSTDGEWLEFQSPNGDAPLKCQPRLKSIQFPDGIWVQTCSYTITLECDLLYLNGSPISNTPTHSELVSSAGENWQIQEGEVKKTYNITHTLNAVGKIAYDSLGNTSGYPWQRAKDFVFNRLGTTYTGIGDFSTIPVSSLVTSSALGAGIVDFTALSPFNFSRNETVDEIGGSYSLTETWLLAQTSGTDVYSISVRKINEDPYTTVNATIQGKIAGYATQLFDYDYGIQTAQWLWSITQNQLFNRVSSYIGLSGITLDSRAIQATTDINPIDGTINYTYSFDNKSYAATGVFETFVIAKKLDPSDYKITYSINGNIKGRKFDDDTDPKAPFLRARNYLSLIDIEPLLYKRITQSKFFPEASGLGLSVYPLSKSMDLNEADGLISYYYEFNNRQNDGNNFNDTIQEDYKVSSNFNREDGKTTYNVNGTIQGLNIDGLSREQRYQNALNYWESVAQPNLYSRIFLYYSGVNIPNSSPVSLEIEHAKNAATISYNYAFNNKPAPLLPGVMYESISVSEQNANQAVQVVAKIPILGRVRGPIIQDINTTTEKIRTVSVEAVLGPTGSTTWLNSFNLKPNYDSYIYALEPDGGRTQEDNSSWDWINGRYQKTVSWIYT